MEKPHIEFRNVTARYGNNIALDGLDFVVRKNTIFGIVGPANSGKTTLLKCINRTIDFIPSASVEGCVRIGETNNDGEITLEDVREIKNVYSLRRRIGMVFPLPVGLPLSIYENVAYGPRRAGIHDKDTLDELVERCLKQSVLWDEVKDRLDSLGTKLSGGQQQRLTLARALSLEPEILCLDEFSIAIDPVTTMKIEDVLVQLKEQFSQRTEAFVRERLAEPRVPHCLDDALSERRAFHVELVCFIAVTLVAERHQDELA